MGVIRFLLASCFLLIGINSFSQPVDTTGIEKDSVMSMMDELDENKPDSKGLPDSTEVEIRTIDSKTLTALRSDADLKYKEPPTVAESLWDRFLAWLGQLFASIFDNAIGTRWGRVLLFAGGVVVIIVVILMLLKVNAFKLFYSNTGTGAFKHEILNENIHEMNFEKLIQEAVRKNDHRLAVRLVFLYALKILADKNLIHWDQGKTNHDYLNEMTKEDLKRGFHELNYFFEYAWYGNFAINAEMFSKVQLIFNDWKERIRS